jgi:hypothetical protein
MHPSPFDFVSALSREECCPLCSELHAAVDQCECSECGSLICPDCASLRPDTSWICASCAPSAAVLAFPAQPRPMHEALRVVRTRVGESAVLLGVVQRAQRVGRQLAPRYRASLTSLAQRDLRDRAAIARSLSEGRGWTARSLQTIGSQAAARARALRAGTASAGASLSARALAMAALLRRGVLLVVSALLGSFAQLRRRVRTFSDAFAQRARPMLHGLSTELRLRARAHASAGRRRAGQARAVTVRAGRAADARLRRQLLRMRHRTASAVIALRSLPLRQHAASLVVATAILVAVARTQTNSDAR